MIALEYRIALYFRGAKFSWIGLVQNFAEIIFADPWIAVSHADSLVPRPNLFTAHAYASCVALASRCELTERSCDCGPRSTYGDREMASDSSVDRFSTEAMLGGELGIRTSRLRRRRFRSLCSLLGLKHVPHLRVSRLNWCRRYLLRKLALRIRKYLVNARWKVAQQSHDQAKLSQGPQAAAARRVRTQSACGAYNHSYPGYWYLGTIS